MARAMKASGGGASTKRKDRRQAKFTPGPGPGSVKPVGVADAPPDAPAAAKPSKTVNGKMSKKRKAEVFGRGGEDGGGEQKGDGSQKKKGKSSDTFFANKTGAKDEFASKKPHSGGDKKADHSKAPATKQEQKELANQQKALVKPNHAVIQEMVGYWEKLRSKKVSGKKLSPEEKKVLVDAIAKASLGKVPTLANNHKGSRVIQALLKFGTEAQKKSVYKECTPAIAQLAKSLYGHFLVKKLIDDTDKKSIPSLLQHVKGQVRALAKHPVGSQVLESLYFPAPPKEKLQMRCEFYGSEFAFFGAGGADGDAKNVSAPKNLRDAMKSKPRAQRQGMLRQMNASLLPILEKGLVSPSLVHAALCEYLDVGGPGTKHEAAQSLAGPAYLRMIHTREGVWAVNLLFAHAGAKQRKAVLKALKGQVNRIARDEHASLFLACAVECVDDTKLTAKAIIAELRDEGLADLARSPAARRILLHLLRPRSTRYVHPHVLATMPDPEETSRVAKETRDALAAGGHFADEQDDDAGEIEEDDEEIDEDEDDEQDDEMDDEMMDDEFETEEEPGDGDVPQMTKQRSRAAEAGGDDMDDDDDEDEGGGDGMDFGVSRKDPAQRRREIFGAPGHLGRSLVAACVNAAASMLRSKEASDVLFETCSGGAGGVVVAAVGSVQMAELHDAVAEAARVSVAGEETFQDEDEKGETAEKLPLHEDYFATRCLRRMALEIGVGAAGGETDTSSKDGKDTPPCFAKALWEGAVGHDIAAWIGGHGAKVVAAICKAGDDATKAKAVSALKKHLPKGADVDAWVGGFFRDFSEMEGKKKKKTEGVKDTKKSGEKKTSEGKKTPEGKKNGDKKTAGDKKTGDAKTGAVKTPGAKKKSAKTDDAVTPGAAQKSVGKSPKKDKFSPRLTRAQREAKAGGKVGKK